MKKDDFQLVKLAAKIGLFFAKVDNDYDEREQKFIEEYLSNLKSSDMTNEEEQLLKDMQVQNFTLQEIIDDTESYISLFDDIDQKQLLHTFAVMINQVINADGIIKKEEAESFEIWQTHFNL